MGSKRLRDEDDVDNTNSSRLSCEAWITGSLVEKDDYTDTSTRYYCSLCCLVMNGPVLLHLSSNVEGSCCVCKDCAQIMLGLQRHNNDASQLFYCPICQTEVSINNLNLVDEITTPISPGACSNLPYMGDACNERIRRRIATCGACEENSPCVFCLQCDFALCEDCQTTMHSKKCFQFHHTVSLDEAISLPERCSSHPNHNMDLFCNECRCTGCIKCCFSGAHQGHNVAPLSDVAATSTRCVEQAIEMSKKYGDSAVNTRMALEKHSLAVKESVKTVKQEISSGFAALRQILSEREEELLKEVDANASPTLEVLSNAISQCETIESSTRRDSCKWEKAKTQENTLSMAHLVLPIQEAAKSAHGLYDEVLDKLIAKATNFSEMIQTDPSLEKVVGVFSMKRRDQDVVAYRDFEEELHFVGDLCWPEENRQSEVENEISSSTRHTEKTADDEFVHKDQYESKIREVCIPLRRLSPHKCNSSREVENHPSCTNEKGEVKHLSQFPLSINTADGVVTLSTADANNIGDRAPSLSIASYSSTGVSSSYMPFRFNSTSVPEDDKGCCNSTIPFSRSVSSLSMPPVGRFLTSVPVNTVKQDNLKRETYKNKTAQEFNKLENVFQS